MAQTSGAGQDIPVSEAVKYLTGLADLNFTATNDAIVISPTQFDPTKPITINAEKTRTENGISFAEGHAVFGYGEVKITGSALQYDSKKHEVEATGAAQLEYRGAVTTSEKIIYSLDTGKVQTGVVPDRPAK